MKHESKAHFTTALYNKLENCLMGGTQESRRETQRVLNLRLNLFKEQEIDGSHAVSCVFYTHLAQLLHTKNNNQ